MRTGQRHGAFLIAVALIVISTLCLGCPPKHTSPAQPMHTEVPQLTVEQQRKFLLKAKVIREERLDEGITRSYRLTLSDGSMTHEAHFQSINERKAHKNLDKGAEMNFVDSYLYNIAAYELAKLIGLDDMLPVTVERKWQGKTGAMAWWLPTQISLGEKQDRHINPPNLEAFNNAMHKIAVFTELIYDTDRYNPGNIRIGYKWELYMMDFTRAFRLYPYLQKPQNLVRCNRELLEKLRDLDENAVSANVGKYLNKPEIEGIMKRRDRIVEHFEKLISEKGENAVLY